jgi:hypothetical protein
VGRTSQDTERKGTGYCHLPTEDCKGRQNLGIETEQARGTHILKSIDRGTN